MITVQKLRDWATEAGHFVGSEVQTFVDFVEGKAVALENAKELLEKNGYKVEPPQP